MIVPTSTGRVFVSDYSSMKNDKPPTKLHDCNLFTQFVKNLWETITTPGSAGTGDSANDLLITAYAMIQFRLRSREVPDFFLQYIRTQLRQTPPNIILITDMDPKLVGFHQRTPNIWPFISVSKNIVDRWTDGIKHCPDKRETLVTEALLKMTLIHETGHWHYTLVSHQTVMV